MNMNLPTINIFFRLLPLILVLFVSERLDGQPLFRAEPSLTTIIGDEELSINLIIYNEEEEGGIIVTSTTASATTTTSTSTSTGTKTSTTTTGMNTATTGLNTGGSLSSSSTTTTTGLSIGNGGTGGTSTGPVSGESNEKILDNVSAFNSPSLKMQNAAIPIHTIRFTISTDAPNGFAGPSIVNAITSWFGGGIVNVTPGNIQGTITATVEMGKLTATNVLTTGTFGIIGCIMSIDQVFKINGECTDVTFYFTDVEVITKVDFSTPDITTDDVITPLNDHSFTVNFCGKCEIPDLSVSPTCTSDGLLYWADVNFTGEAGVSYLLNDDQGSATQLGGTGTHTFGPYPSNQEVSITVAHPDFPNQVCQQTIQTDCLNLPPAPTCTDGIQNQGETGLDCGGSNCSPCISCDMLVDTNVECIASNQFMVHLNITGGPSLYQVTDDIGNAMSGTALNYTMGPYTMGTTANIAIERPSDAGCIINVEEAYSNCGLCNYTPPNDQCVNATNLNLGVNGPYNNYCANNISPDPNNASCFFDATSHSVWFAYVGTGNQSVFKALRCAGISDYEADLQMIIYDDCTASNELACSDDVVNYQPLIGMPTVLGQTYYILIDGFGSYDPIGEFCLEVYECSSVLCSFDPVVEPVTCASSGNNGSIDLQVAGGNAPYSFIWDNGATSNNVAGLTTGNYAVTVTEAGGCSCETDVTVGLGANNLLLNLLPGNINNSSGTLLPIYYYNDVNLEILGGTPPFTYDWDKDGYVRTSVVGLGMVNVIYADNASWSVTVTDSAGCNVYFSNNNTTDQLLDIIDYTTYAPTSVDGNNGSIDLDVTGGTAPYTYLWSNGDTGEDISGLASGWFSVTVTDNSSPSQNTLGWYWVPPPSRRGRNKTSLTSYPNPITNTATISFTPTYTGKASVTIYNVNGQEVAQLFNGLVEKNQTYNALLAVQQLQLSTGIYLSCLQTEDGHIETSKLFIYRD